MNLKNISELKEGINNYVDKYNNRRFHSSTATALKSWV